MTQPLTTLHYAPNSNVANGRYAPGGDGFNLADVSSVDQLNSLPSGVKGLVWLGMSNGADSTFQQTVSQFIGDPKLYGFYLVDEPDPSQVSAANLKAESDWIHANVAGAKTFIVLQNMGTDSAPVFNYNPSNTDIDLFGLDPYPVQTQFGNYPGSANCSIIGTAVNAAVAQGIPLADIVPVYQAFGGGGYSDWIVPTAAQEQQILSTWGSYVPNPALDYAYSWGVQDGDTALSTDPALQQVFAAHNAATAQQPTNSITTPSGQSTTIAVVGSTATLTTNGTTSHDNLASSVTINANGSDKISIDPTSTTNVTINGGASRLTVTDSGTGNLTFNAGSGNLTLTGGHGTNTANLGSCAGGNIFFDGNMSITGGTGPFNWEFTSGNRGTDVIPYKIGHDTIVLNGYGTDRSMAIVSNQSSGGNTTLVLSDNTHITLTRVPHISNNSIVLE
jgi:hypothetical protein